MPALIRLSVVPPTSSWDFWKQDVITTSATFVPDAGTGTYWFRAHVQNPVTGEGIPYSSKQSITVS